MAGLNTRLELELQMSQELKLLLTDPLQGVEGKLDHRQRVVVIHSPMSVEQADIIYRLLGACITNSSYGLLVKGGDPRSLALDLGEMGAHIKLPRDIILEDICNIF